MTIPTTSKVETGLKPKRKKPKRKPLASKDILKYPKDGLEDFEVRIVNDVPGRVKRFIDAGWEIVTGDKWKGYNASDEPSKMGSIESKHVGKGNHELEGIVMKIPKDWYHEDQQAKQKELDEIEEAMNAPPAGLYAKKEHKPFGQ